MGGVREKYLYRKLCVGIKLIVKTSLRKCEETRYIQDVTHLQSEIFMKIISHNIFP